MRTIKFRGKDILTQEWVYGDLLHIEGGCIIATNSKLGEPLPEGDIALAYCKDEIVVVIRDTVGQFTGLKDKNGVEIYEGDIIGCHNPDIKHLIFYDEKEARFKAALNGDINNDFVCVCGLDSSRWNATKEVIGNIHDSPELLKERMRIEGRNSKIGGYFLIEGTPSTPNPRL